MLARQRKRRSVICLDTKLNQVAAMGSATQSDLWVRGKALRHLKKLPLLPMGGPDLWTVCAKTVLAGREGISNVGSFLPHSLYPEFRFFLSVNVKI